MLELDADDFRFDPRYPDLKSAAQRRLRVDRDALVGRPQREGQEKLLDELVGTLSAAGIDTENVMVCFKETTWENWAFGGGRFINV